jgi:phage N-6-adenine-methyltransferase
VGTVVETKTDKHPNSVHFSSKTDLWETPQPFFDALNAEFGFMLDVCALPENAKCANYFTPAMDGLKQEWTGICWMNPPYGRQIGRWLKKAYESSLQGATIVCCLPCRTDTLWWHSWVMKADEVRFIRGRLKFSGCRNSAPFASAIVVFRPLASSPASSDVRQQGDSYEPKHPA